jgi:hypothetical protein
VIKTGHVIIIDRYTRSLILANPSVLFAFGDNLARVGYGGQAAEARGCLNAIGIPTKISPSQYIFDEDVEQDMDRFKWPIVRAFAILRTHLRKGGTIVWPKDGVGTGLARLPITAPRTHAAIEGVKDRVFSEALSVTHQTLSQIEG